MSEKMLNTRIQQKHDIEVNWSKAVNFIPKIGEVIIYDPDENHAAARVKIGDGVKTVVELAFIDDAAKTALFKEIDMVDEKVEALGQLVGDASIPEQIEEALLKTQADWEVNDETSAAYIKNKPFGHGPDYFEYKFNGNLEDYEYFPISNVYLVKVGEPIEKSILESKENNFAVDLQIEDNKRTFPQLMISKTSDGWGFAAGDAVVAFIIFNDENEMNIPKGTYVTYPISHSFIVTNFYYNDIKIIDKRYLPSVSKSDWQETNELSDSYIKNKTHYEDFDIIKLNKDFLNNEKIEINSEASLIKVSDETIDFNKLIGSYFLENIETLGLLENRSVPITTETLKISDNIAYIDSNFYVVAEDSVKMPNYDITLSKGVWFVYAQWSEDYKKYVSELRIVRRVYQLDEKFIPSTIARVDDLPIAITPDRIDEICGTEPMVAFAVNNEGDALISAGWPDENGNIQL